MATWSDKQLGRHKRAQSYISSAGATLGIAALGAATMKTPAARKTGLKLVNRAEKKGLGLKGSMKARNAIDRAGKATNGLTAGSAGVGGIGGYNFAAIQSQEAKKAKVRKMDENPFAVSKAKTKSVVGDPATRRSIKLKDTASGLAGAGGAALATVGATRLAAGRGAVKVARFGGARTPQSVRNANKFAAKSGAMLGAGIGGMVASDKLTTSADRQWAGAPKKRVRKSDEVSKLSLPKLKNPNVTRGASTTVGAPKKLKPTKTKKPFNPLSNASLITGSAVVGAGTGLALNPVGRKERVRVMRQQGKIQKSLSPDVAMSPFAKKDDWKNISEHQTRAQRGRRTKNTGSAVAAGGATAVGLGAGFSRPGDFKSSKNFMGNIARGNKATGASTKRAAGNFVQGAKHIATRKPGVALAAVGAGAAGVGAGMHLSGKATNRRHEAAISRQRKQRAVAKSMEVSESPFAKAYSPERSRHKRTEAYQAGGYAAAGALGATGARKVGVQASNLKSALKTGSVSTKQLGAIGRTGGKGLALVAAGAGAAAGAKKIGDYRKGKGRSYKALPLS